MEYLQNSMYKDRLASAGLYYSQLFEREKVLKSLNTPKLGDSLLRSDGTPWMADLKNMAPKLNWDDLTQRPALPLGSWLKTDPWDDKVHQLNAKIYAYMNPRDKMPLELTPIFYKLQRYDASKLLPPAPSAAAPTTAAPAAAAPPANPAPAAAPATDAPAAGTPPATSAPAAAPDDTTQPLTGTSNPPQQ
jgi:hypothetical protein